MARTAAIIVGVFVISLAVLWLKKGSRSGTHRRRDRLRIRCRDGTTLRRSPRHRSPVRRSPQSASFSNPRGAAGVAYESGDYNAALAKYLAAIEKNPDDAESLSNLGQVLIRLNRTPESIPYFERAVSILPGRWAYQFNLARAQGLLGHMDEAVAGYRRAQSLFPDDYATTFNLAMTLHRKGDDAAAVGEYQKAIALQPEDASFRKALGDQLRAAEAGAGSGSGLRRVSAPVAVGRGCGKGPRANRTAAGTASGRNAGAGGCATSDGAPSQDR